MEPQTAAAEVVATASPGRARTVAPALQEHFRTLLTALRHPHDGSPLHVVGVTSSQRQEGVSTIALNLAAFAAQNLQGDVALIDGHLMHPSLAERLQTASQPGLKDYLRGEVDLTDCLCDAAREGFAYLPAGGGEQGWDSRNLTALFESLRSQFALVVVDLPPVAELGTCQLLAQQTDGLLLVVAEGRTTADDARRAMARLARCRVPLLGAVFNGSRHNLP